MKIKLFILIIVAVGLLSGGAYLYSEMYDCLSPPNWMKIPRQYSIVDCLQKYSDGTLPDYSAAREEHAANQARKAELVERFKDIPEVKAFYVKYDDANIEVREDHLTYFAGNGVDFRVRMNLYFDENDNLDYMSFNCYVGREHKTDVPDNFILKYLREYDCAKPST